MSETVEFGQLFSVPLRNGVSYASKLRGTGVPMINMKEIFAHDRIGKVKCELAPITEDQRKKYLLEDFDLLFARQSLTYDGAGKCSLVLPVEEDRTWESHLIRVRLDPKVSSPEYYYYYFRSPQGRRNIESIVQQVAAAGIRGSDLARLRIPNPPLAQQRAIAEVLGALDDKIAANTKLASTADEWVRAEYDRIASLSDEKCTIADLVAHRRNAADPSTIEVHVPYVGLEHIPRRSMWLEAHGSSDEVSSNKSHFQSGDILFGKLRPYFHKIVTAPTSGICSTDILVLTSIDENHSGLALASLAHDNVVQAVTAASEGTRMPRTSWKDLSNVEVPWPGQVAAAAFSAKVQTVRSSVIGILAENQMLATTRDVFLPQLMSGKLRVKEAEEILAAAI